MKTCPRWPPHAVQVISVRVIPNVRSSCLYDVSTLVPSRFLEVPNYLETAPGIASREVRIPKTECDAYPHHRRRQASRSQSRISSWTCTGVCRTQRIRRRQRLCAYCTRRYQQVLCPFALKCGTSEHMSCRSKPHGRSTCFGDKTACHSSSDF